MLQCINTSKYLLRSRLFKLQVCCKLQKAEDNIEFHPQAQPSSTVPQNVQYYTTPKLPATTQPLKQLVQTTTIPTHTNSKGFVASNENNTNHVTSNYLNRVSDHATNSSVQQENNVGNIVNEGVFGTASSLRPHSNSANGVIQGNARPTNNFPQEEALDVLINVNNNSLIPYLLPGKNVCGVEDIADRIYGGDIAGIQEFPWMARLKYRDGKCS